MPIDRVQLTDYLIDTFDVDPDDLEDDTSLFAEGLLDSFHLLELVAHLEELLGAKIKPLEINLENFDSVDRILAFVESRAA